MRRIASSRESPGRHRLRRDRHLRRHQARGLFAGQVRESAELRERDDAHEPPVLVHHGEIGVGAAPQVLQQLAQGRGLPHDVRRRVEGVGHAESGEHVAIGAVLEPLAAPAEPPAVERVRLQPPRHQVGDHRGQHERQDDVVVVGHLEHQQHAGDRRGGGGGDHRAHAHQCVRLGVQAEPGKERGERHAEGAARSRADEQRRGEDAARPAEGEGDRGGEYAAQREQRQRTPGHAPEDLEVHRQVAVAHQQPLGEDHQDADQHSPEERDPPAWTFDLLGELLHARSTPARTARPRARRRSRGRGRR